MRKFIYKLAGFLAMLSIIILIGLVLPPTPKASSSLLFGKIQKDSLLSNVRSPRIIFLGGSNLSFGLDSNIIKDSLGVNPINLGIHASIGLSYMMKSTLPYIKSGDIVVVIPEYSQFYDKTAFGAEELLRTIVEVKPSDAKFLGIENILMVLEYIPKVSFSRFSPIEYVLFNNDPIYGVRSFNSYGDAVAHWGLGKRDFTPFGPISGQFNDNAIDEIIWFEEELKRKGALLYLSYPCYQEKAFDNSLIVIREVVEKITKSSLNVLGKPERYRMADSLMFNTSYHLNKTGACRRTQLLIEDLKENIPLVGNGKR